MAEKSADNEDDIDIWRLAKEVFTQLPHSKSMKCNDKKKSYRFTRGRSSFSRFNVHNCSGLGAALKKKKQFQASVKTTSIRSAFCQCQYLWIIDIAVDFRNSFVILLTIASIWMPSSGGELVLHQPFPILHDLIQYSLLFLKHTHVHK